MSIYIGRHMCISHLNRKKEIVMNLFKIAGVSLVACVTVVAIGAVLEHEGLIDEKGKHLVKVTAGSLVYTSVLAAKFGVVKTLAVLCVRGRKNGTVEEIVPAA